MGKQNKSRNKGKFKPVSIPVTEEQKEIQANLTPVKPSKSTTPSAPPSVSLSRSTPRSSSSSVLTSPPRSVPLSGHVWRVHSSPSSRSSSVGKSPHIGLKPKSLAAKQNLRRTRELMKEKERALIDQARQAREEEKRKAEQKAKQKEENEKKSQVVQTIKETSKIKKMTPKQFKMLRKA
jgi:rRNA-processing protein CGR1